MTATFTCEDCGGVFPMGDDEEARSEAKALWGDRPIETMALTCDGCHERIVAQFGPAARRN